MSARAHGAYSCLGPRCMLGYAPARVPPPRVPPPRVPPPRVPPPAVSERAHYRRAWSSTLLVAGAKSIRSVYARCVEAEATGWRLSQNGRDCYLFDVFCRLYYCYLGMSCLRHPGGLCHRAASSSKSSQTWNCFSSCRKQRREDKKRFNASKI